MKITIENYEAFVLDHLEGRLSDEQSEALFAFLDAHPELEVDLDIDLEGMSETLPSSGLELSSLLASEGEIPEAVDLFMARKLEGDEEGEIGNDPLTQKHWKAMQKTKVEAPLVSYQDKDSMLIPSEVASKDEWYAAVMEGDVKGPWVERVLASALAKKQLALFNKTKLQAPEVPYCQKEELERTGRVVAFRPVMYRIASIAAVLVLALGTFWMFTPDEGSNGQVAQTGSDLGVAREVAESTPASEETTKVITTVDYDATPKGTPLSPANDVVQEEVISNRIPGVQFASTRAVDQVRTDVVAINRNIFINTSMGDAVADATPAEVIPRETPTKVEEPQKFKDFVFAEAVNTVLGREKAEDETLVEALASKVEEKTALDLAFASKGKAEKDKGFFFRLGKFSVER
ncbi:MAG: hypothetical protein MK081_01305 [Flavobacteriales bacterium]|nr:hypothetical protein [Flavobacteriales bacterium]